MAGLYFHVPNSTPPAIGGIDANTVLMLHMDGDQSDSQHVVTANGNPQFSTAQSKFGGSSMLFDGSGDYLTAPHNDDFEFGSGDFTIDFWAYFIDRASDSVPICKGYSGGGGVDRGFRIICGVTGLGFNSGTNGGDFNLAVNAGEWLHIAVVSYSGTIYGYVNGIKGSGSITDTIPSSSTNLIIGGWPLSDENTAGRLFVNGYIDELRITKGEARWTTDFSGSLPSAPYTSDANTKLLLHFDGDVSTTPHTLTVNGNPQLSAATTKFNGAMYFDGDGDYLSVPDDDNWNFGGDDFTIDFWVNFNSLSSQQWFVFQWPGAAPYWIFYLYNGQLFYTDRDGGSGGSDMETGTGVFASTGVWYHVAFVRNSATPHIFIDGVDQSLTIVNPFITMTDISSPLIIGGRTDRWVDGYMDEVRISKGIARWTSNFTPESGPYTE